jgi:hypothetical protein
MKAGAAVPLQRRRRVYEIVSVEVVGERRAGRYNPGPEIKELA